MNILPLLTVCWLLVWVPIGWSFVVTGNAMTADIATDSSPDIIYQLFTRKNKDEFQILRLNDLELLNSSNFNFSLPTKIYAPGKNNDGEIAHSAKTEYLIAGDVNVIVIDWRALQTLVGPIKPAILETAIDLKNFIEFLVENGVSYSQLHLIGHSAGCPISGMAASSLTSGRIPRITGLDPGDGSADLNDTETVLDVSDADFVDVIHTSFGFTTPVGHIDFQVNNGMTQPGCPDLQNVCCAHCRAADLFAESITTTVGFWSRRCDSYDDYVSGACDGNEEQLMGEHVPLETRGVFYVTTNKEAPWAVGHQTQEAN